MKLDLTLSIAAIVTSVITLGLFVFLHYVIEPRKANIRKKEEKLKNLYAPLFTMIVARLVSVPIGIRNTEEDMVLLTLKEQKFMDDGHFVKFIFDNSRYASPELLLEVHNHVEKIMDQVYFPTHMTTFKVDSLVRVIVKEYNRLRKELGEGYDEEELLTGIPEIIKRTKKVA